MSKVNKFIGVMLFLVTLTVLGACGNNENKANGDAADNSDQTYELTINNWAASTHHYAYNVFEPWAEMVDEKTDGRVKVTLYHGSSLGKSTSVYQDVKGGLYDVGLIVANYFYDTGFFPYTIGNLPFAFKGPTEAANVLEKFAEKYAKEELSKDIVVMPTSATDGYDIFATKPIKEISDLKNLKMRVNGKSEIAFVEALGAVPVSLSIEDTYEALQKGTINTTFYTPIGAVGTKFYEPAPYVTKLAISVTPIIPIMNKDFYESLPEDLKQIFDEELNPALTELITDSYEKELEVSHEQLAENVKSRGEFIELTDDQLNEFRSYSPPAWEDWLKEAEKKGYNADEMLKELNSMLEEAGYEIPYQK